MSDTLSYTVTRELAFACDSEAAKFFVEAGFAEHPGRVRWIWAARAGADRATAYALRAIGDALTTLLEIGTPLEKLAETAPSRLAHYLAGAGGDDALQLSARTVIAGIIHACIQIEAEARA